MEVDGPACLLRYADGGVIFVTVQHLPGVEPGPGQFPLWGLWRCRSAVTLVGADKGSDFTGGRVYLVNAVATTLPASRRPLPING